MLGLGTLYPHRRAPPQSEWGAPKTVSIGVSLRPACAMPLPFFPGHSLSSLGSRPAVICPARYRHAFRRRKQASPHAVVAVRLEPQLSACNSLACRSSPQPALG
jgi:hypothetical protein